MKRAPLLLLVVFLALVLPFGGDAVAQPLPPELTQAVNDFASVIDPASKTDMERQIRALQAATGDIVVVATIETYAPYADIREYAVQMFENHGRGIGNKGKDNGLLVLLAIKDRAVWVEVGYDLEQFVTDGFAGEVSRNTMTPYVARGEYGQGLFAGLNRVIGRIAQGRGVTIEGVEATGAESSPDSGVSPLVIVAIIIVVLLMSRAGGPRSRMKGGRRQWGAGPWSGWNSGVGPFGGGGGSFGGGGFGGGFGGFGGGRSGGGGGGARW